MFFGKRKSKTRNVTAPVNGMLKQLSKVNDPVFSAGTMGYGFAVEPENSSVCAPVAGVISTVFPGGHAIGITTSDGAEALIHIGIDTVKRKGDGFKSHVKGGERVAQGERLVDVDFKTLKDAGFECDVILVISSGEKCSIDEEMLGKNVTVSDTVMSYSPK